MRVIIRENLLGTVLREMGWFLKTKQRKLILGRAHFGARVFLQRKTNKFINELSDYKLSASMRSMTLLASSSVAGTTFRILNPFCVASERIVKVK